jgi:hypothetical protein
MNDDAIQHKDYRSKTRTRRLEMLIRVLKINQDKLLFSRKTHART